MLVRTRTHRPVLLAVSAVAIVLAGLFASRGVGPRHPAAPAPRGPAHAAPLIARTPGRSGSPYLAIAERAYARSRAWWSPARGWYRQFLPGDGSGTATAWGIVHQFEATDALAIADPTPARIGAARAFGVGAERYWDPNLKPVPGYGPTLGDRGTHAWFDDEAWWGVAFYDAYRATHDRRFLADASRALAYVNAGWNPHGGGIFWDNHDTFVASESLAGGTLIAAGLYQATHDPRDLALARKYLAWANAHIRGRDGLYGGRATPAGPMPYVEGPLAEAQLRLCHATRDRAWCRAGEALMAATARRFPVLEMGPQYDALYVRAVLAVYALDHQPRWYRIAAAAGQRAQAHAADARGLELRLWDGRPISAIGTAPGKLQTHAATTSVFAWLAASAPPHG